MPIALFDPKAAERFRERINIDPGFALQSRDMTLNLVIEIDGDARLICFRDGQLTKISRFVPVTEPVDITVTGDLAFWRKLLAPVPPPRFQNLYAAVRANTCEVRGNGELYAAYFAATTRLIDAMRDLENGQAAG